MTRQNVQKFIAVAGFTATAAYATAPSTPFTPTRDANGNTAVGNLTLAALDTPSCPAGGPFVACFNTAVGSYSLRLNTSGHMNSAIGSGVLGKNTSGSYNTAVGSYSLLDNTTGSGNTGFGSGTLQ